MSLHYAKLAHSPRLQRLLALLQRRGRTGATSLEIAIECRTVAAATCVSELRSNGYDVLAVQERDTDSGAKVYRYRLVDPVAPVTTAAESTVSHSTSQPVKPQPMFVGAQEVMAL